MAHWRPEIDMQHAEERVSGAVMYGSDKSLKSAMDAKRKFNIHQEMPRLPQEGEVVVLGKWMHSHVKTDGVSTVLALSRPTRESAGHEHRC